MIHIAIQRHPYIDVDGALAEIQQSAAACAIAWGTESVKVSSYGIRKPRGSWRVHWSDNLPADAGGIHLEQGLTPYAVVRPSEGLIAATHELFEMLVDPLGKRFVSAVGQAWLVEVCDPVEAFSSHSGVSDWVNPLFYTPSPLDRPLSHLGNADKRLVPMPGGYLSRIASGDWYQDFADAWGNVETRDLGPAYAKNRNEKDRRVRAAES